MFEKGDSLETRRAEETRRAAGLVSLVFLRQPWASLRESKYSDIRILSRLR